MLFPRGPYRLRCHEAIYAALAAVDATTEGPTRRADLQRSTSATHPLEARQPHAQQRIEPVQNDRLGEIVCHPRYTSLFLIVLHRFRCDRDDRQAGEARVGTNPA